MSYRTVEVELENGRVQASGPDTLPQRARGLLTLLDSGESAAALTCGELAECVRRDLQLTGWERARGGQWAKEISLASEGRDGTFGAMKIADSTAVVGQFHRFLSMVEHGESVRIRKRGRAVARLVPDCDFMSGEDFARVFDSYKATDLDKAAADEIEQHLNALKRRSREKLVAH